MNEFFSDCEIDIKKYLVLFMTVFVSFFLLKFNQVYHDI